MKPAIQQYLGYLRSVRNASPNTLRSYAIDLSQFVSFLTPPETETPHLRDVTHLMIREFLGHLHDHKLQKSSIARKVAAIRSFFKFAVRERMVLQNPARMVATPKLPRRVPSVLSAEDMGAFLDGIASAPIAVPGSGRSARGRRVDPLMVKRDRAILELLYASGLRVSELTGLNLADIERKEKMLRVLGKGNKERIVPYGSKAEQALEAQGRPQGKRRSGLPQPPGHPSDDALGRADREKVCPAGQRQLGSASALLAPRLCHPPAG
jgi:integrase/recombinase XerC